MVLSDQQWCILLFVLFVSSTTPSRSYDDEEVENSGLGSGDTYASSDNDSPSYTVSPRFTTVPSEDNTSDSPVKALHVASGIAVMSVVTIAVVTVVVIKLIKRRSFEKQQAKSIPQTTKQSRDYYVNMTVSKPMKEICGEGGYLTPVHLGPDGKASNPYMVTNLNRM